jgi:hypothetical protein
VPNLLHRFGEYAPVCSIALRLKIADKVLHAERYIV